MSATAIILGLSALFSALTASHNIASGAVQNDRADLDAEEQALALSYFETLYADQLSNNSYWNSLDSIERKALMREYMLGTDVDAVENVDFESLLRDLGEYSQITATPVRDYSYADILSNAQDAVDKENEELLAALNQDLQNTSDAYTDARNQMLTSDFMRGQQTVDAMASDMSRARRNAIEAGASAGVRIASNVNAILSAQNKMSQQSLETSNQLAQMLVNQRNAESGLRSQWRDAKMSTFDRAHGRANTLYNEAEIGYQENLDKWRTERDGKVSATNRLVDRMQTYRNNSDSAY